MGEEKVDDEGEDTRAARIALAFAMFSGCRLHVNEALSGLLSSAGGLRPSLGGVRERGC